MPDEIEQWETEGGSMTTYRTGPEGAAEGERDLGLLKSMDRGAFIGRKLKELEEIQKREFAVRDQYNRLVNEIKMLARQAAAWQENEITCETKVIDEISRLAALYDPCE